MAATFSCIIQGAVELFLNISETFKQETTGKQRKIVKQEDLRDIRLEESRE